MKKSGKLACHVVNSNSLLILCRHSKYRWELSRYLKRLMIKSRFLWCEKCDAARHCAVILRNKLFISIDRNRIRWPVLSLSQDGVCRDSFENFSVKNSKHQSNDTKFNPPLFSLVNTYKILIFYDIVKLPCGGCIFTSGSLLAHLQLAWSARVTLRDFLQVSMVYLQYTIK